MGGQCYPGLAAPEGTETIARKLNLRVHQRINSPPWAPFCFPNYREKVFRNSRLIEQKSWVCVLALHLCNSAWVKHKPLRLSVPLSQARLVVWDR